LVGEVVAATEDDLHFVLEVFIEGMGLVFIVLEEEVQFLMVCIFSVQQHVRLFLELDVVVEKVLFLRFQDLELIVFGSDEFV
jgi:hypothetical protein